jgi:hypothetical protein
MNTLIARQRFHAVAVAALAAAVFAGFAKTFYFRIFLDRPPLARAAQLHGIIATVWIALHYTQARLVAAHRVDLHRRLGIFGAFVAALLAVQAISMAIGNAAAGHGPAGRDPLQFLSVPIGTTTMFALFVGSAIALRRKRESPSRSSPGLGERLASTRASASRVHRRWPRAARLDTPEARDRVHRCVVIDRSLAQN